MSYKLEKMASKRKILVKDLNPMLTCTLCEGYLVDATVLSDCLHVFCRGCIIKYFEYCRTACPNCNILYKKKNQICFRSDPQIQSLVYKLVPSLYSKEMQTREDFYRSTGVRASSSCSDDSVIDKERDNLKDQEAWVTSNVGDKTEFFSPEDMISLSLEYYQAHLDTSSLEDNKDDNVEPVNRRDNQDSEVPINSETDQVKTNGCDISVESKVNAENDSEIERNNEHSCDEVNSDELQKENKNDVGKRFLKCPAAVSMQLLQKFLRMKFGLTLDHRVDIIHKGEVLPNYFTLIDVAYTFKWNRSKPMRFFYRIFTPMKIKPIKIINTTSTSGSKQLQIVQVDETTKLESPKIIENQPEEKFEKPLTPTPETPKELTEDSEDLSSYKERLMAHLQLQSTKKIQPKVNGKEKEVEKEPTCVYEYVEPDKEEIKRFAEKRDREWALQKKLDEKNEHSEHHISKKRKKSKHSKNESVHKKRKLHAEITSNEEEDLKLKVKITPHNSHKHKHHKNSQNHELSNKEKLLQMRQVRHKHVNSEDKTVQTISTSNVTSSKQSIADKINEKLKMNKTEKEIEKKRDSENKAVTFSETDTTSNNKNQLEEKETVKKATSVPVVAPKEVNKPSVAGTNKDTKTAVKEWGVNNKPTLSVKQEKLEGEKQKTFLKSFQSYTEKYNIEKIKQTKMEARQKINNSVPTTRPLTPLEKKINSIQQQCTIEPKKINTPPPHITKTESPIDSVPKVLNSYPPGFTVSKIEAGFKRKAENDGQMVDKRPSLEITLIPHTTKGQMVINRNYDKNSPKRPPPSTIPLDRIRKSNAKSGISIIPKPPEICDNIGALDLSNKTSPENSPKCTNSISKAVNGLNIALANRNLSNLGVDKPTHQLSNLQMLSKVASEHPILNKIPQQAQNVVKTQRPTMPNLQNLAAAGLQTSLPSITPNCSKPNLPKLQKLTEMAKTQFKISGNAQIRSPRPNQNQNIRNIPNPSLLVRQQNQNRLNSLSANVDQESLSVVPSSVNSKVNNIVEKKEIPV